MQNNSWSQWNFVQAGKHTVMGFVPPCTPLYLPESYVKVGPWVSHRGEADTPPNTNHCFICCRKILENLIII